MIISPYPCVFQMEYPEPTFKRPGRCPLCSKHFNTAATLNGHVERKGCALSLAKKELRETASVFAKIEPE